MNDPTEFPEGQNTSDETWEEIGRQFQALGESLAAALRAAWEREETRQRFDQIRQNVEAMVNEVSQAIQEGAASPQAQQARDEAQKAAQNLRRAGEQTFREAQPRLVSALRQVNQELQKLITKLE